METAYREVATGLAARPNETRKTFGDHCGEDWQDIEKVEPLKGDPWKIDHNRFNFRSDFTVALKSNVEAPAVYRALIDHLSKVGGWDVAAQSEENDFIAGLEGTKHGIQLDAFHTPDGNGGTSVYIELQSECYRHPNA